MSSEPERKPKVCRHWWTLVRHELPEDGCPSEWHACQLCGRVTRWLRDE